MTGRKISVPGYDWKKGKLTKRSTYSRKRAASKQARKATKVVRGRRLI